MYVADKLKTAQDDKNAAAIEINDTNINVYVKGDVIPEKITNTPPAYNPTALTVDARLSTIEKFIGLVK